MIPDTLHRMFLILPILLEIKSLNDISEEDIMLLGKLQLLISKLAKDLGIADNGYRVISNVNGDGGQEVYHIHYHILGGEKIGLLNSNK